MQKKGIMKNCLRIGLIVTALGIMIGSTGFWLSGCDKDLFYEESNHVWYKTIRFGEDFMFGIGE